MIPLNYSYCIIITYAIKMGLSRCLGPGECLHSFIHAIKLLESSKDHFPMAGEGRVHPMVRSGGGGRRGAVREVVILTQGSLSPWTYTSEQGGIWLYLTTIAACLPACT